MPGKWSGQNPVLRIKTDILSGFIFTFHLEMFGILKNNPFSPLKNSLKSKMFGILAAGDILISEWRLFTET